MSKNIYYRIDETRSKTETYYRRASTLEEAVRLWMEDICSDKTEVTALTIRKDDNPFQYNKTTL